MRELLLASMFFRTSISAWSAMTSVQERRDALTGTPAAGATPHVGAPRVAQRIPAPRVAQRAAEPVVETSPPNEGRGWGDYRQLWRTPGAPGLLVGFILARLPTGMIALTFTLATLHRTGSLALAGLVTACYALAMGVGMPVVGRAVDRRGPVGILVTTGVVYPMTLIVFAVVCLGVVPAPTWTLPLAAAAAGLSLPPVAQVVRSVWNTFLDEKANCTANAVEGVLVPAFYIAGPAFVGLLAIWGLTPVALLVSAAANAVGVILVTLSPRVRGLPTVTERTHRLAALRQPGMVLVLALSFGYALGSQGMEFSIIGWAQARHTPGLVGVIFAGACVGALVAAAAYGAGYRWLTRFDLRAWYAAWAVGLVAVGAVTTLDANAVTVFTVSLVAEVCSAPMLVLVMDRMNHVARPGLRTETFSWRLSALLVGSAFGATACGAAAQNLGVVGPSVVGVAFALAAALLASRSLLHVTVSRTRDREERTSHIQGPLARQYSFETREEGPP